MKFTSLNVGFDILHKYFAFFFLNPFLIILPLNSYNLEALSNTKFRKEKKNTHNLAKLP